MNDFCDNYWPKKYRSLQGIHFSIKKPKITLYQINLGQKPKTKILNVLKKGAKINVFQFIWEVNGQKLSNVVTKKAKNGQK